MSEFTPETLRDAIVKELGCKEWDIIPNWTTSVDDALTLPIGDCVWLLDQWQDKSAWRAYIMDYTRATKYSDRDDLLEALCEQKTLAMAMSYAWLLYWADKDNPLPQEPQSHSSIMDDPHFQQLWAIEKEMNDQLDRLDDDHIEKRLAIREKYHHKMSAAMPDPKREQRRFENNKHENER